MTPGGVGRVLFLLCGVDQHKRRVAVMPDATFNNETDDGMCELAPDLPFASNQAPQAAWWRG